MKAVVIANGQVEDADRAHLGGAGLLIAADGGGLTFERWGIVPHAVVGDMDSLDEAALGRLAARGAAIERHPGAKDETDLELAIARARAAGASEVVLLGAFGGARLDLTIANALLLAGPAGAAIDLRAEAGPDTLRALRGPGRRPLAGRIGATVSLVPVGTVTGVRTEGLAYPLTGDTLDLGRARGVSNEIVATPAAVSCDSGVLLVIERRADASIVEPACKVDTPTSRARYRGRSI